MLWVRILMLLVQTTRSYAGMASDSSNNIYVCVGTDIYKQTNSTGNFVSMSVNIPYLNAIAFHPNGNVYACCDNGQVRMQNAGIGAFNLLQTITNFLWGITVAPNGDVYVCSQNVFGNKQEVQVFCFSRSNFKVMEGNRCGSKWRYIRVC